MRFIDSLCPPALLYLLFVTIQIALDISFGMFVVAGIKLAVGIIGVVVLDALCGVKLGVVSWAIVAAPFIITSLATAIAMGIDLDRLALNTAKEHFTEKMHPKKTETKPKKMVNMGSKRTESFTMMPTELEERQEINADVSEEVDYPFSTTTPY
jgi:hypothetical protein